MKNSLFLLLFVPLIFSCKNGREQNAKKEKTDTVKFYPLSSFFQEQITYVDLRGFPIYQIKELNGKRDSVSISTDVFKNMAAVFLQKDISTPRMQPRYTETVFHDLSTQSLTLNYRAKNASDTIQNIDILLDENTKLVKRVFIRSGFQHNDTSFVEQCNWKANKSFQINRSAKTPGGYVSTELNYINWNDKQK